MIAGKGPWSGASDATGAYAEMDREEFWKAREKEQRLYSKDGT
jgi:hypothetical protein